jgi:hypothetical protein
VFTEPLETFLVLKKLEEAYEITLLSVYNPLTPESLNSGTRRDSLYNTI